MHAAQGLEFDHVYVLGLHAARMPGAHTRTLEPIAPALMKEALPQDDHAAHVAEMRRLLHVAMTRARRRLVLVHPQASDRGAAQPPSPFAEEARAAVGARVGGARGGAVRSRRVAALDVPDPARRAAGDVKRTGSRLGELRFDTDLDVSHAVVRYLEVVKLAALIERAGEPAARPRRCDEVNARIAQAITPEQREIFQSSSLDDYLLDADRDTRRRAAAIAAREEPSLEPFLPRRGDGLVLSASDIDTYRTCPLKYKFARVFRIPQEPTLNQRFGILVHQVLERFHAATSARTFEGCSGCSRPAGGAAASAAPSRRSSCAARRRRADALLRALRDRGRASRPYFERSFSFQLGPHVLRGRVDRVDRLPEGGWELIDYKTGRAEDARRSWSRTCSCRSTRSRAREAWQLERRARRLLLRARRRQGAGAARRAGRDWIAGRSRPRSPTGSSPRASSRRRRYAACSICDYRLVCPAAEQ